MSENIFIEKEKLLNSLEHLVNEDKFSGVVLIAKGNDVFFEKACGMADKSRNLPNNLGTKFNLASASKMFTAAAIAQLAEQGKLAFSDTIDRFNFGFPKNIAKKITIEHLLTHTSGLGNIFFTEYMAHKDEIDTVEGFMPYVVNQSLSFEPGLRHEYSNAGFIVLGAIIESISGENYYAYIRKHITEPLGMADTGFFKKHDDATNLARGYTLFNNGMPPLKADGQMDMSGYKDAVLEDNLASLPLIGSPAGGGYSTARDMLKFSSALINNKLLSKKYTSLVTTGKAASPFGKYGYGFEDLLENNRRTIGHSGGAPGINALLRIFIDDGVTVVILSNYDMGARRLYGEFLLNNTLFPALITSSNFYHFL